MEGEQRFAVHLFKRPLQAQPPPSGSASATPTALRLSARERLARVAVGVLGFVDWARSQPHLWFVGLAALAAGVLPATDAAFSLPCALLLTSLSFVLIGASFPDVSRDSTSTKSLVVVVVVSALFVSPVLWGALGQWVLPLVYRGERLVSVGFSGIGLLPASHAISSTVTRDALGNAPLALYLSTAASLLCAYFSPFLLNMFLGTYEPAIELMSVSWTFALAALAVGCFVLGVLAQRGAAVVARRRRDAATDADREMLTTDRSQASTDSPHLSSPVDPVEAAMHSWRQRAVRLNADLALLSIYILLSAVGRLQSPQKGVLLPRTATAKPLSATERSTSAVTWSSASAAVPLRTETLNNSTGAALPAFFERPLFSREATFAFAVLEAVAIAVPLLLTWLLAGKACDTPEDRISVVCAGTLKAEVNVMTTFLVVLAEKESARVALAPVAVFVLVQAVVEAFMTPLLRRWRNSVNCRPGTTLLPQRFSHNSRSTLIAV